MRISRKKTEFLKLGSHENEKEEVWLNGEKVKQVEQFRYLGSLVDE